VANWGGPLRHGGPPCRGWRCVGRADVGAAELAGGGRRPCARYGEERRGASEKRGASGTGATRRGCGEDGRVLEVRRDLAENG
jgi:hypothetical protein